MNQRALLLGGLPLLVLLGPSPAVGQQQLGRPTLTAAVQVTANPSPVRAYATPLLARKPKNGELVAAEVDVRGSRECAVHVSADDGRSWFRGGDLHVNPSPSARSALSTAPTSCPSSIATACCA